MLKDHEARARNPDHRESSAVFTWYELKNFTLHTEEIFWITDVLNKLCRDLTLWL
jgi:hypothetical protein